MTPKITAYRFPEYAMDHDALSIIQRLQRFGYLAYFVGGCVRDALLGHVPKDFDIVTSAHPREIRKIFRNAHLIGRRFKLAHLHFPRGKILEVATFRQPPSREGVENGVIVEDNEFGTPETDAHRRDFTINALFYDPLSEEIIDFVNGLEDIEKKTVRCIGTPIIRFREDPIRMLRAIKFAARLDLQFEAEVAAAMRAERSSLALAARPRLQQELIRYLQGGAAQRSFELLLEFNFLRLLCPELSAWLSDSNHRIEHFTSILAAHDNHTVNLWKELSKEELILSLLYWPWVNGLVVGDSSHKDALIPKKKKKLKLLILRLLAPSAARLGMSIKTMHGLARILSLLIFHRLEKSHDINDQDLVSSQVFRGANLLESLLVIKARAYSNFEPDLDWSYIQPLLSSALQRIGASQNKTSNSPKLLIPSKPVIKPTERRKRKKR